MAWIVQPREMKAENGPGGSGIWHLTAESDEGGGFAIGCDHQHPSAEEAQRCLEARKYLGSVTGSPLQMDKITINGVEQEWPHDDPLSHERICEIAGQPVHANVTYSGPRKGDSQRSGMTHSGKSIKTEDGMHIDCIVTGNA